jgi:hypothetical protein
MVPDAKFISNNCRDALGGPDFPEETEGLGTLGEQPRKLGELLSAQSTGGTRRWLAVQGFGASLARPL